MIDILIPILFFAVMSFITGYMAMPGRWPGSAYEQNTVGLILAVPFGLAFYLLYRFRTPPSWTGMYAGIAVAAGIWHLYWKPRVKAAEAAVVTREAEDHMVGDLRVASLRPRKVTDYVHPAIRWLPHAIYVAAVVWALSRGWRVGVQLRDASSIYFLLSTAALIFGEVWMRRRAAERTDLRSANPAAFEALVENARRMNVRNAWAYQLIAGGLSAVAGALAVERERGSLPWSTYFLAVSLYPYALVAVTLLFSFAISRSRDLVRTRRWIAEVAPLSSRSSTPRTVVALVILAVGALAYFSVIPIVRLFSEIEGSTAAVSAGPRTTSEFATALSSSDTEARFYMLADAAKTAFAEEADDSAAAYANELLALAPSFQSNWNYGNAIHHGNLVLGRVALRQGDVAAARAYLLRAGETPGSPQLNSFGPNMELASDLLEIEEREVVLQYFDLCERFWNGRRHSEQLRRWREDVADGDIPEFGAHLRY